MHSCSPITETSSSRRPGTDRLRSAAALVGIVVVAAAGLAWFWNLGTASPLSGASLSPSSPSPENVLLQALRLVGVGVTAWLLISTLLALAAATLDVLRQRFEGVTHGGIRGRAGVRAHRGGLSTLCRRCALPGVRRLVERAVTVTILTSVVASVPVIPVSAADPGDIPPSGLEEPVVRAPTMVDEPPNPEVHTPETHTPEVHTPEVHTPRSMSSSPVTTSGRWRPTIWRRSMRQRVAPAHGRVRPTSARTGPG
ncbi:MAG: hypothetical protein M5U31_14290 [Acidimicrobiia bacterium]|nr:hypothetical protein [Acidimicrobiia bacterium]